MTQGGGQRDLPTSGRMRHVPVLLKEVLEALKPQNGEIYIDGTFGAGGYTRAILESRPSLRVLAIDRDPDAIKNGQTLVAEFKDRLFLYQGRFSALDDIAQIAGFAQVDGVVLDIGVSSMQLDEAMRGFSFMRDGPLDMRMGQDGETAADLIERLSEKELADIFWTLGEERKSRLIARKIVERRKEQPFLTTLDLANFIESFIYKKANDPKHPATRVFQALRVFLNRELEELIAGMHAAERILKPGGRLVIVTFHSLEDRIVKRFLTLKAGRQAKPSRHHPSVAGLKSFQQGDEPCFHLVNRKSVKPQESEVNMNPRARSAKLRAAVRTAASAYEIDAQDLGLPGV